MLDPARIDDLRRRIDADPTSIAFAELAELYRRGGHHAEAIALCRTGLARHPAYLSARVTLGRALTEEDDLASAQAELEQVLRVAPDSLAAIKALAEVHERRQEPDRARELMERASNLAQQGLDLDDAGGEINRHLTAAAESADASAEVAAEPVGQAAAVSVIEPEPLPVEPEPLPVEPQAPPVELETLSVQPEPGPVSPALQALERFLESIQAARLRHEGADPGA